MSRTAYVDTKTESYPRLTVQIDGYNYGFNVKGFPEGNYEWLVEVVERQMQEIHNRAVAKTKKEFQTKARELLGV